MSRCASLALKFDRLLKDRFSREELSETSLLAVLKTSLGFRTTVSQSDAPELRATIVVETIHEKHAELEIFDTLPNAEKFDSKVRRAAWR